MGGNVGGVKRMGTVTPLSWVGEKGQGSQPGRDQKSTDVV